MKAVCKEVIVDTYGKIPEYLHAIIECAKRPTLKERLEYMERFLDENDTAEREQVEED